MQTEKFKQIIEQRMTELSRRLATIEDALDEPADRDLEDQAIELEDDEVLEGVGRAGQREMRLLQLALKRIEDGSYGICQICGNEIAEERLIAVPFAPLCRDCARRS
ncbi:TraR/DksA family transcriptional regulator [Sulfitobacter sabulilitoris]|uniref:TraR/DksA family transcriptional regulator n=1 Tax=Sulfitobacter sabulilitoris TaxID=2562655 RepID=A0A5S3PBZ2_9RHOB|nr:TraR/DksA C4-type zinc finger protein [Sulfitobacter sabulilitoris]TMM51193.1 TraR/DksA family transcriptional regulator [Sulfitobacter sabulilitoris]